MQFPISWILISAVEGLLYDINNNVQNAKTLICSTSFAAKHCENMMTKHLI
jgi:hypothetical protein